jgi:hypothetical protein
MPWRPMTTILINNNTNISNVLHATLTFQIESVSKIEVFLLNFATCPWRQPPNCLPLPCCKVQCRKLGEKNLTPTCSSHQRRQMSASSRRNFFNCLPQLRAVKMLSQLFLSSQPNKAIDECRAKNSSEKRRP